MTSTQTYRIEIRDAGQWVPAPGEATGWTLAEARRAVSAGLRGMDDTPIAADDVRIVDEASGAVADQLTAHDHAAESLRAGIDRLHAVQLSDGRYAYLAPETDSWYRITERDICALGDDLRSGEDDAYSLWCTVCGEEIGDTEHDQLDMIADATDTPVAYRCQCGTATGDRCEWTGDREDLVHVRWVPDSDRGSAQASGSYRAYAISLYVTAECAERLEDEPFVRVIGPAYE